MSQIPNNNNRLSEWDESDASFSDVVKSAIRTILDEQGLGIDRISKLLKVSPRTIQRRLKAEDATYMQLLNEVKHEQAVRQLTESGDSIKAIALALGYAHPSDFSRAFKKRTNMSPQKFREERWREMHNWLNLSETKKFLLKAMIKRWAESPVK